MNNTKRGHISLALIYLTVSLILLSILYFLIKDETLQLIIILLSFVILIVGLFIYFFSTTSLKRKIRKQISKIMFNLDAFSLDTLKESYLEIYRSYMKLSEKNKQNFYTSVNKLRQEIEEKLKAKKKLELLLDQSSIGNIEEQKKTLGNIHQLYQQLPHSDQEQYTAQIQHIQEKLEKSLNSN
ncbi:hypothetical protein HYX11_05000 [Candidatus Woesearchaeota archaeon]|nr:hypothetical protein [Candidatus Woesearchaeota archaeon]